MVYAVKTADASKACALLSSGAAAYDVLTHLKANNGGKTVGVVGVGGLGQCAIKTAKTMGNKVIAFSSTAEKQGLAEMFGADEFCVIQDAEARKKFAGKCDITLDTRSNEHQIKDNLDLCANSGTICEMGIVFQTHKVNHMALFPQRKSITGSLYASQESLQAVLADADKFAPQTVVVKPADLDMVFKELSGHNKEGKKYVVSFV